MSVKEYIKRILQQSIEWEKLQIAYVITDLYLEYIKIQVSYNLYICLQGSYNSTTKRQPKQNNGQQYWIDIYLMKIHKWPTAYEKMAHINSLHKEVFTPTKVTRIKMTNNNKDPCISKDAEKLEPMYT